MTNAAPALAVPDHDAQLVSLWLHGRSAHTTRSYGADVARFLAHVEKPLAAVTLADLQAFADTLRDFQQARPLCETCWRGTWNTAVA